MTTVLLPSNAAEPPAPTELPRDALPELAFVMAPRQNLFFHELVGALRSEAEALGARTSVHEGNFPPPRDDLVYVLTPPHEYFSLMHGRVGPPAQALKRTVLICGEQPGTPFFDHNVALARRGGAVFDINAFAVRAFAQQGITAQHLQLGWTAQWDHLRERERDIDVLFMGCASSRRAEALARFGPLWRRRCEFVVSDNSRPNWHASESFRSGDQKWDLLGRAKLVVNVHQGEAPYFEWLRVVQAMSNGAVVLTEHSLDFAPLVPGRHFLAGDVDSLPLLAELLLDDGDRWWRIQTEAYRFMREELRLGASVASLVSAAAKLAATEPPPAARHLFFEQRAPDPERGLARQGYAPPVSTEVEIRTSTLRRSVKDIKLDLLDVQRALRRMEVRARDGSSAADVQLVRRTLAHTAPPRVSVLMGLHNYEHLVSDALGSLLSSREPSWEIVVVDDGSGDRSQHRVERFMDEHEDVSVTLLRHPVNRGLGHARNSALGWARGEYCFILDADNEIYPHCLRALAEVLDQDRGAAFAYGILECFDAGGPNGLLNTLPWEPERLRAGNYIDAMALVRTAVLRRFGGWSVDRRLHGWEDFDLWCQLAEHGLRAAHVPSILARYRRSPLSMLSLTNVSVLDAFALVTARAPELMAGVQPPA